MNKYKIRLSFHFGWLEFKIKNEIPPRGICKNCKQEIFWIKVLGKMKVQATKVGEAEYMSHSLCCPTVLDYEQKKNTNSFLKKKRK